MAIHWAGVMLAWLAGVALQLQQAHLTAHGPAWVAGAGLWGARVWGWWARGADRPSTGSAYRLGITVVMVFAAAWATTEWRAQQRWLQQWPVVWAKDASGQRVTVWVTGRVMSLADRHDRGWRVRLDLIQVDLTRGPQPESRQGGARWHWRGVPDDWRVPERVSVGLPSGHVEPVPGQVWRWPVQLDAPDGLHNPGAPDVVLLAWGQGVRASGRMDASREQGVLLKQPSWWSVGVFERLRMHWRHRIWAQVSGPHHPEGGMTERVAGIVRGLSIGEQNAIEADDWDALRLTGTAHLAAISGLHIAMMGLLVAQVVDTVWRRSAWLMHRCPAPVAARWALLGGAWVYALLAGWGLPAQRTVWMIALMVSLRHTGRMWPWPVVVVSAAVGVTVIDPWALLAPGFWLSFVAVAVLMWGGGVLVVGRADDRSLGARARSAAHSLWHSQWVATLGLAPLSLIFFQAVSIVGLLANLVCIPLFSVVITPLALLGTAWAGAWQVLQPLLTLVLTALSAVADWPFTQWQVPVVSGWAAALALLAGAMWVAPCSWRMRLLALPLCLPLVWSTSWSQQLPGPSHGHVDLMAADVGQGTAVLVRTARHTLLFDTGPAVDRGRDAGRRVLLGLMRSAGVGHLDVLMLSHGDADHIGGAASVVRRTPVGLWRTSLPPDHELLVGRHVRGQRPTHQPCEAGQQWQWDGVQFDVLHPSEHITDADERADNAVSCVLSITAQGRRVLIAGDIESAQEWALVQQTDPQQLRSEVLLVPHHGSQTSSTEPFLKVVQPKVAVILVGARYVFGHPHPPVVQRYRTMGVRVVQTPHCGAWWWSSERAEGSCWRHLQFRYWHSPQVHQLGP